MSELQSMRARAIRMRVSVVQKQRRGDERRNKEESENKSATRTRAYNTIRVKCNDIE